MVKYCKLYQHSSLIIIGLQLGSGYVIGDHFLSLCRPSYGHKSCCYNVSAKRSKILSVHGFTICDILICYLDLLSGLYISWRLHSIGCLMCPRELQSAVHGLGAGCNVPHRPGIIIIGGFVWEGGIGDGLEYAWNMRPPLGWLNQGDDGPIPT